MSPPAGRINAVTTTAAHRQRRFLLSLLTLLTLLGIAFGPTIDASASTRSVAETRVRAIDTPTPALVATTSPPSPTAVGISGLQLRQLVSATGVATNSEQLSLFDADDFLAPGARRSAQFGENWQTASLDDALRQHVGSNPSVSYSGQKTTVTGANGTEVIIDQAGGYFRIRGSDGVYRMLDGSPVPANVPIIKPGGSTMSGVPKDVR